MDAREQFYEFLKEHYLYSNVKALVEWDQQVLLPTGGQDARAEHIAFLARKHAQHWQHPRAPEILEKFSSLSLSEIDAVNLKEARRELKHYTALPDEFIQREARAIAHCFQLWEEKKASGDFAALQKPLEQVVDCAREKAELLGYTENPYDALLDLFEPGLTVAEVAPILQGATEGLRELLPAIESKTAKHNVDFGNIAIEQQRALSARIVESIGFSFTHGALNEAAHPFATTIGPGDVRLTTRYREDDFSDGFLASMHEAGHGMYEQGFLPASAWTAGADAVSMGIHESQSLFWESFIGRSKVFCTYLHGVLSKEFPEVIGKHSGEELWQYFNRVKRGLVRVAADEVSYCLHIQIRFQAEKLLINKELEVADLPDYWNERYEKDLGIRPPSATEGVMQDVHWYAGLIGYFPSYALGYFYAALLHRYLQESQPTLLSNIENGDFAPLRAWLGTNIHERGKLLGRNELIKEVTGLAFESDSFLNYIKNKYQIDK